ncbi:ribonuclease H-like domain-containing protein [Tanacetum coccineum]
MNVFGVQTYDTLNGKWKGLHPKLAQFCGVYDNVCRRAPQSGAGDEDYSQKALEEYRVEYKMWKFPGLKKRNYKSSRNISHGGLVRSTTQSVEGGSNLNRMAGDEEEEKRTASGMFLSRSKFVEEILERAHIQKCNPCKTLVDTESKLGHDGDPTSDPTLYRSLASAL